MFRGRVAKELADLQSGAVPGVLVRGEPAFHGETLALEVQLQGPRESPYEDGAFLVRVQCGASYPLRPPSV